jgi:hypothetical protein
MWHAKSLTEVLARKLVSRGALPIARASRPGRETVYAAPLVPATRRAFRATLLDYFQRLEILRGLSAISAYAGYAGQWREDRSPLCGILDRLWDPVFRGCICALEWLPLCYLFLHKWRAPMKAALAFGSPDSLGVSRPPLRPRGGQ